MESDVCMTCGNVLAAHTLEQLRWCAFTMDGRVLQSIRDAMQMQERRELADRLAAPPAPLVEPEIARGIDGTYLPEPPAPDDEGVRR
jgi:hypothetical protein